MVQLPESAGPYKLGAEDSWHKPVTRIPPSIPYSIKYLISVLISRGELKPGSTL